VIAAFFLCLAAAGCLYLIVAAAFARLPSGGCAAAAPPPAVSVLKPLHGDEPRLFDNLATFCAQDYPAPVEIVCGVRDPCDSAIAVVKRAQAAFADADLTLVVDETPLGANPKVANLANMARRARRECLVISDSDIAVGARYLERVAATLAGAGVGAVTCFYYGAAATGFWSQLSALAIDAHFLPNALFGLGAGLAKPCFGSTIALTRARLAEIGGFEAVADRLADDYAIGEAVRARGLSVAVADVLVAHSCAETSFGELWRHELRWARTVRDLAPLGYAGSFVTHPLGAALIAAATGAPALGAGLAALAVVCRIVLFGAIRRRFGFAAPPSWLLPLCDLLSFATFVAGFFGGALSWRDERFDLRSDGRLRPLR
jgi:ceramide glucosyltransferase